MSGRVFYEQYGNESKRSIWFFRGSCEGSRYSHACTVARISDLVDSVVSVGIRSMDCTEVNRIVKDRVFFTRDIKTSHGWIDEVVRGLSQRVYVTLDLDVFDPSVLPSANAPTGGTRLV